MNKEVIHLGKFRPWAKFFLLFFNKLCGLGQFNLFIVDMGLISVEHVDTMSHEARLHWNFFIFYL